MASSTADRQPQDPLSRALAEALEPVIDRKLREILGEYFEGQATQPKGFGDMDALCAFMGVSRPTAKKLIDEGLPFVQVGDHRRFDLSPAGDVVTWLKSRGAR